MQPANNGLNVQSRLVVDRPKHHTVSNLLPKQTKKANFLLSIWILGTTKKYSLIKYSFYKHDGVDRKSVNTLDSALCHNFIIQYSSTKPSAT